MIKQNMLANLIGKVYSAGIAFIVLPIYLKYLGSESYGLVGVFITIQAFALLLDSGITPMVTRDIARMKLQSGSSNHLQNLLRTTEVLFILAGVFAFIIIFYLSDFLSSNWLNINTLSLETVTHTIILIGVIVGLRFNIGLYGGTIMALEKQVSYNIALSIIATIKSLGAVYLLMYMSGDIVIFFKYQIAISIIEFVVYRYMVMKYLPKIQEKPLFTFDVYKGNLHFLGGYSASMLFVFILLQSGNIVLSKILSLSQFGYYSFSMSIVSILQMAGGPLFQAISPRLMSIYANDKQNLETFYHKACQAISFLLIPAGLMLAIYSYEIIFLWTKNSDTSHNIYMIVSLLSIGTLLNLLATMPGQLQMADGRTKVMVWINGLSILLVLPLNIWFGTLFGGVGVASVWILLNILYLLTGVFIVHPQLLSEDKSQWILEDILKPFVKVGIFLLIGKYIYFLLNIQSTFLTLVYLSIIFTCGYVINFLALPLIRSEVSMLWRRKYGDFRKK